MLSQANVKDQQDLDQVILICVVSLMGVGAGACRCVKHAGTDNHGLPFSLNFKITHKVELFDPLRGLTSHSTEYNHLSSDNIKF